MRIFQFCSVVTLIILITVLLFTSLAAIAEGNDPHPKLSLSLSLGKTEAYPGETVPVTVTLRINDVKLRNISYPRLDAADGKNISFAPPVQESDAADPAVILQRFTGQICGVTPGRLIVGPARLDCEVMKPATGSAAFFGGQESETVQLTAAAASVAVLSLPSSGKPYHFSGAVGTFSLSVTSLPAHIAIGEPLTVTTMIRGDGSLADAACPMITGSSLQSFPVLATRSASQLVCEQVVVPARDISFPPVTWSCFDPAKGKYTVLKGNITSRIIAPPSVLQSAPPHRPPVSAVSIQPPKASPDILSVALVIVTALFAVALVVVRRHDKLASAAKFSKNTGHLRVLLQDAEVAAANGDVELFFNIAFEIIQIMQSVDKRYNNRPDGISALRLMDDEEQHRLNDVNGMNTECDKVRYGRILPDGTSLAHYYERLNKILSFIL